ncbi:type IV secretion system DNA-binding domain-containing protein [Peribacillus simplex]|uniref:type IV secretory system conjugative DNA transfer family protein n=1 Tax=Peribacillus TaxID=2675229 RepID=UPI00177E85B2|nr:type IV secretion system DNA-binding domain-containing protein [Brevibacillus sp. JNUCC-41]QOS89023.1 type IV secretion system DNA-binding domain-containing protein [Brevibacillus sp. JNUCC-41]
MIEKTIMLEGFSLVDTLEITHEDSNVQFKGHKQSIPITYDLLSKHLLFTGAIGTGKTKAIFQLVSQIIDNMSQDDVIIIFDTKGDFREEFYTVGRDEIISNDESATQYWNLTKEALIDDISRRQESLLEIANSLFEERIKNSSSPFFASAAKDIFYGIMTAFTRDNSECYNEKLKKIVVEGTSEEILKTLTEHSDLSGITDYIRGKSSQSQGVISELRSVGMELFVGNFAKKGQFSIREFVRKKGGRVLYIEYDMAIGKVLTPIYKIMFDLAIKESLCRDKSEGNVYYVVDEFKLLPNLYHIDNGVNFGRSLGAKFILAMQNIEQISDSYGKELAHSILSGFSTLVSFRVHDKATRSYIKELYGENRREIKYLSGRYGVKDATILGNVIEDWHISQLGIGEAIISLPGYPPVKFQFSEYKNKS